jgi:hypothetical protein
MKTKTTYQHVKTCEYYFNTGNILDAIMCRYEFVILGDPPVIAELIYDEDGAPILKVTARFITEIDAPEEEE